MESSEGSENCALKGQSGWEVGEGGREVCEEAQSTNRARVTAVWQRVEGYPRSHSLRLNDKVMVVTTEPP